MEHRPRDPGDSAEGNGEQDRDRLLEQARVAPLRARILELYEEDKDRSLSPSDLFRDLSDEFNNASIRHIEYHLKRLSELGLIPSVGQESN